jgi:ABC-2 type transport system permease protein
MHILQQNLRLGRANLLGFGLGLALLSLVSVLFLPTLKENGEQMTQLIQSLPKGLMAAFGISEQTDMLSPEGFLHARLFGLMVPLLLLIQGIGIGAATLAGEEERGQLEVVAAHPVSRARLFLEKLGVLAVALGFSSLLLLLSIWIGLRLVNTEIALGKVLAACLGSLLLGLLFGGLALAIGGWTGRRSLAAGLASALAVLAYFWNALTPLSPDLAGWQKYSPFYQGVGYEPIKNGLDAGSAAILLLATLVVLGLGLYRFRQRDLGV